MSAVSHRVKQTAVVRAVSPVENCQNRRKCQKQPKFRTLSSRSFGLALRISAASSHVRSGSLDASIWILWQYWHFWHSVKKFPLALGDGIGLPYLQQP